MYFFLKSHFELFNIVSNGEIIERPKKITNENLVIHYLKSLDIAIAKKTKKEVILNNGASFNLVDSHNSEKVIRFLNENSSKNVSLENALFRINRLRKFIKILNDAKLSYKDLKALLPTYECELSLHFDFIYFKIVKGGRIRYFGNRNIDFLDSERLKTFLACLKRELKFSNNFRLFVWHKLIHRAFDSDCYPSELYEREKEFYDNLELSEIVEKHLDKVKQGLEFKWSSERGYYAKNESCDYDLSCDYYEALNLFFEKEIKADPVAYAKFSNLKYEL